MKRILLLLSILFLTAGCASTPKFILHGSLPYAEGTPTTDLLIAVPELDQPVITIAVYNFPDRTGKRKPSTKFSQLSSAVSQAPETYLISALKCVGGGEGARYFGIGAHRNYRTDQVTIALRLVAVQTGEILLSVSSTKTIASHKIGGDAFKFLDLGTKAIEIEVGVARNEPTNYAIRTAIEYSVLQMI